MTVIPIPEVIVPGKPLGRHIDDRVAEHRATGGPPPLAPKIISVVHKSAGLPLDQGDAGSCTGDATVGALNTVPHWAPGNPTLGQADAYRLYSVEEVDLGYGPYPPNDQGGTGMAACEAGIKLGWLDGFQSTTDVHEAVLALVLRPVITGVNWYTSFDDPAPSSAYIPGLVTIADGATVRGGHEFVVVAINAAAKLVWAVNSWGDSYGVPYSGIPGGCFCFTFSTWNTLLCQAGDVTVPRTALGWKAA